MLRACFNRNFWRDLTPSAMTRLKRLAEAPFWQRMAVYLLMSEVEEESVGAAADEPTAPDNGETLDNPNPAGQSSEHAVNRDTDEWKKGAVSEHELVNAAKAGEIENTLKCFSVITRHNHDMVEHFLFKAHISALMVLCKANKLTQETFTALLSLRENHTGQPTDNTVGLMKRYDGMTPETAQRIICRSDERGKLANEEDEKASESDESQALDSDSTPNLSPVHP